MRLFLQRLLRCVETLLILAGLLIEDGSLVGIVNRANMLQALAMLVLFASALGTRASYLDQKRLDPDPPQASSSLI